MASRGTAPPPEGETDPSLPFSPPPPAPDLAPDLVATLALLTRLLRLVYSYHVAALRSSAQTSVLIHPADSPSEATQLHSLDDVQRLSLELNDEIARIRNAVKQLRLALEETEGKEKRQLTRIVKWAEEELAGVEATARFEIIACRKRIQQARHLLDHQALFGGAGMSAGSNKLGAYTAARGNSSSSRSGDPTQDTVADASSELTTSLQRTLGLLSSTLTQSTYSASLLAESSQSLSDLSQHYTSFAQLLANSRSQIRAMEQAEKYELLVLFASLLFFWACVLYIVKVRLWDRGVGAVLGGVWRVGKTGVGGAAWAGAKVGAGARHAANLAADSASAQDAGSLSGATASAILDAAADAAEAVVATATAVAAGAPHQEL